MLPPTRRFTTILPVPKTNTHFQHLPIELQAEIFLHSLPDRPQFGHDSPHVLLQVCSMWRNIAISTPRLWTSFDIDLGDGRWMPSRTEGILESLSLWLCRSRTLPLTVGLAYRPSSGIIPRTLESAPRDVLELLLSSASRWRHIGLILPGVSIGSLLECQPHDFPQLETLDLQLKGPWAGSGPVETRKLAFNWAQLTSINVWFEYDCLFTLDEWAHLLSEATSLTHCRFNAKCVWTDQPSTLKVAPLGLRTLDMVFQAETDVVNPENALASFLGHLDLPTLTQCQLAWQVRSSGPGGAATLHTSLVQFLAGLRPTLEGLSLAYFPLQESDLIECFNVLPFLTDINLQYSLQDSAQGPISDRTLVALTLPRRSSAAPTHGGLLPWLQTIQVHCRASAFSTEVLVDMIESRKGTPLRDFSCLMLKTSVPMNILPAWQVKQWEDEGKRVSLQFIEL